MRKGKIVQKRESKFNNVTCEADGKKFDSMKERHHYLWLKNFCEKNGLNLEIQKVFRLSVCKYIADFVVSNESTSLVIDTKSSATVTEVFKLKAKMMKKELSQEVFKAFSIPSMARKLSEVFSGEQ